MQTEQILIHMMAQEVKIVTFLSNLKAEQSLYIITLLF